jgi:uncharacterized UBP type Zn finger protein
LHLFFTFVFGFSHRQVVRVAIAHNFRLGAQQDAHEFLRYLLDAMQTNCLTNLSQLFAQ